MFAEPISTEFVYQISEEEQARVLKDHFALVYEILAENQLVPNAGFEERDGVQRCLMGIPTPFFNTLMGCPKNEPQDQFIEEQIAYFNAAKMPFIWCFDEGSNPVFQEKLLEHGFQDGGIFSGVIGILNKPILVPEVPDDCLLELVDSESVMDEFNDLVCDTFAIQGVAKDLYKKVMWEATRDERYPMFHWLARKGGRVVSAISTRIDGDVVSFWNGASLPEFRKQGLSTALGCLALRDATSKGCRVGISYLTSEGLAFGICSKLGAETKWRFHVFVAPEVSA